MCDGRLMSAQGYSSFDKATFKSNLTDLALIQFSPKMCDQTYS